MPPGATDGPARLSPEDAFDLAAYVNGGLPRTHSEGRAALYPCASLRPAYFSIPERFPGDVVAERRAKLGPFTAAELSVDP